MNLPRSMFLSAVVLLGGGACAGPSSSSGAQLDEATAAVAPEPDGEALLASWQPETIRLPPEFAPGLPEGEEELRFAPGMFDAEAPDFWSYVFVMRLEEELGDEDSIARLLELYYDGLLSAVGGSRGLELPDDPATAHVRTVGEGRYEARIEMIDAFVTGEPITLRLEVVSEGTTLRFAASPQPEEHAIWASLRAVLALL